MKRYYPHKKAKLIIVYVSIAVLICSLFNPAFYVQADDPQWSSAAAFFFGFFGPLSCKAGVSWLANPCLVFAWIRMRSAPMQSAIAAFFGLLIAGSFTLCNSIMVNEAGGMAGITGLGLGYYLWVASMAVCFAGGVIMHIWDIRNPLPAKFE